MLENKFKAKCLKQLRELPGTWWVIYNATQVRGIPDVIGCVWGRFVALEFKRAGAKKDKSRETLQKYVASKIAQTGGVAFDRVDPANWDAVFDDIELLSR